MIKLGDEVKDKLTDFKGTVIARAEYLYGCIWICVVPRKLHDGKSIEDGWFDEARFEVTAVKPQKAQPEKKEPDTPFRYGPTPSMPKRSTPKPNTSDWKQSGVEQ